MGRYPSVDRSNCSRLPCKSQYRVPAGRRSSAINGYRVYRVKGSAASGNDFQFSARRSVVSGDSESIASLPICLDATGNHSAHKGRHHCVRTCHPGQLCLALLMARGKGAGLLIRTPLTNNSNESSISPCKYVLYLLYDWYYLLYYC